jgi:EAL domain-containing protein (putative c-di-GMP-specific phosphodiesterase class I)
MDDMVTHDKATTPDDVREALRRNEIGVVFQRCIDLRTDERVGEEVFVRWRHPDLGDLRPGRFLDSCPADTVAKVDRRVVHETVRAVRERIAHHDQVPEVWLNLALASLRPWHNRRLVTRVARALDADLTSLVLEISHADLLAATKGDLRRLRRLTDRGAVVHVDNVRLDVLDELDVERLGVRAIKVDATQMHLRVRGHGPGRGLTLHDWGLARKVAVIVSRLETEQQRETAQELGLWLAQGNLFAEPSPAT